MSLYIHILQSQFYVDFLAYQQYGYSITGLQYRAIQYGPVPAEYERLYLRLQDDSMVSVEEQNGKDDQYVEVFQVNTLKKHLHLFIERLNVVNSSQEYPHRVSYAVITSEYPIQQKSKGIKVAYSLAPKGFSKTAYEEAEEGLLKRRKRPFDNIPQSIGYPEEAVRIFLKRGSSVIKLRQYYRDEIKMIIGHQLIKE